VVGFTADDAATVEYVRIWFSFLQQTLENAAPESAQKNINLALLRALDIPLPPLALQREFARRLAAAVELRSLYREASQLLDSLFASLQHRAFRGEL
jgi:type I restriction enzyme S subunit